MGRTSCRLADSSVACVGFISSECRLPIRNIPECKQQYQYHNGYQGANNSRCDREKL